jgi:NADH-quinone oxidoreductase subunit B
VDLAPFFPKKRPSGQGRPAGSCSTRPGWGDTTAVVAGRAAGQVVVITLGLACCGIEARPGSAPWAGESGQLPREPGRDCSGGSPNVLVVAGTITSKSAARVRAAYEALPEPRVVVAFGACAISGGPYWDSYNVIPGTAGVVPVDLWVPGCPPRPEEVRSAIEQVRNG